MSYVVLQMPRRRKPTPDTRPTWRDPDLPVLIGGVLYPPHEVQRICRGLIKNEGITWRDDETYDLRKNKSNKGSC